MLMVDNFPVRPAPEGASQDGKRRVKLGLVQAAFEQSKEGRDSRDTNLAHVLPAIKEAASSGAEVVVVGELFLQGPGNSEWSSFYSTRLDGTDDHARELEGLTRELQVTLLMGATTFSPDGFDVHNSALVFTPDVGLSGVYNKAHLASFPYLRGLAREGAHYSPGSDLQPIDTRQGRIGAHICWDIFFPEVARVQALLGADYLLNLAAAAESFEGCWEHLMWARAVENGSWYAMTSVVGTGDRTYVGGSRVVAPDGTVVARAKDNSEEILLATLELDRSLAMRSQVHMFATRHPRMYEPISWPKNG
jgi:predicted amidohydrolase